MKLTSILFQIVSNFAHGLCIFMPTSYLLSSITDCKLFWLVVYISCMVALYVAPLFLHSPCIVDPNLIPPKPHLIAHRGASGVSHHLGVSFLSEESYALVPVYNMIPILILNQEKYRIKKVEN